MTLQQTVRELEAAGELVVIDDRVDANLEAAAIHLRVQQAGGPAILFNNVVDCRFPMLSNLFGTKRRAEFLFRKTLAGVQQLVRLKLDPSTALAEPGKTLKAAPMAWAMRPKFVRRGPILHAQTQISELPQQKSWPADGGAFITLPQVYTEDVTQPGWRHSNLGMYRVQLSGNDYSPDEEIGLHYQIHRGIGFHHTRAIAADLPFRVNIFVGGPPAMNLAAVMPLPEGLSELTFAGALAGRRVRLIRQPDSLPLHADADFCIVGTVLPNKLLPEGPFGDHLGYYSLRHDFPVLRVEKVFHRQDAIWPLTVVGRPPQEDTIFGQLIHEITGDAIPSVLPGVQAVHAVDAAGVHPLLLAIGSERYTPYASVDRPQELLTQANAILGQGQLSLAKFLLIINGQDDPQLDIHDVEAFLEHLLARADWRRDLHFHTQTTIDTLDYSGQALNAGSKLVIAATGPPKFSLRQSLPPEIPLPDGFSQPRIALPGVVVVQGPPCRGDEVSAQQLAGTWTPPAERPDAAAHSRRRFCESIDTGHPLREFRWIVLVDDSELASRNIGNFVWILFTRANPATDIDGVDSLVCDKHWGCEGPLVLDARRQDHHAPALEIDLTVTARINPLFAAQGPLAGIEP